MNAEIVIKVENLTKTYRLYNSLADRVKETFHPFRKNYHFMFNALKNISFDVKKGETIGIIGRNGSGKSTLLQVVCGILSPTSGSIEVKGKVSALLELGAGFNPNYTGRQNVFINAAILGLDNSETEARFDDIASFADIGAFIDQPVKSYSSGMYVRLAFAVAISIEPDILVIDEALAVGDEAFQRKCYARIKQIQERGGTILFVSHGAAAIIELCNRAMMLDQGELILCGSPKKVTSYYHKMIFAPQDRVEKLKEIWRKNPDCLQLQDDISEKYKDSEKPGRDIVLDVHSCINNDQQSTFDPELVPKSTFCYEKRGASIILPSILTPDGIHVNHLVNRCNYVYTYSVYFEKEAYKVRFGMLIKTVTGYELGGAVSAPGGQGVDFIEAGTTYRINFYFRCYLNPGVYFLNAGVVGIIEGEEVFLDRNVDITMFRVQEKGNSISNFIVDLVEKIDVSIVKIENDCLIDN